MVIEKKIKPKIPISKEEKKLLDTVNDNEDAITDLLQKLVQIESLNFSEFKYWDNREIFKFTKKYFLPEFCFCF